VRDALEPLPGVADVKVDVNTKTVTLSFDESELEVEAALEALEAAGKPATVRE
jgi:mercuric ion binding protein